MYTVVEPPLDFETLNAKCRELLGEILSRLPVTGTTFKLRSGVPLFAPDAMKDKVYVVRDGNLGYHYRKRTLFYFQDGDLIGLERDLDVMDATITSEFATVLEAFDVKEFFGAIDSDPDLKTLWREYVGRYLATLFSMVRSLFKDQEPVLPEVRSYGAGSEIIKEGSVSHEVFTMADGHARIIKNGHTVGEILQDETFGAISAFTGTPRSATVVATQDCLVLALPKASFIELIMSRPNSVNRLLEEMATTIVDSGASLFAGGMKL